MLLLSFSLNLVQSSDRYHLCFLCYHTLLRKWLTSLVYVDPELVADDGADRSTSSANCRRQRQREDASDAARDETRGRGRSKEKPSYRRKDAGKGIVIPSDHGQSSSIMQPKNSFEPLASSKDVESESGGLVPMEENSSEEQLKTGYTDAGVLHAASVELATLNMMIWETHILLNPILATMLWRLLILHRQMTLISQKNKLLFIKLILELTLPKTRVFKRTLLPMPRII